MSLPLVFHPDYSPQLPNGHRFPMPKFRLLRDHLVKSGLTTVDALLQPALVTEEQLSLAHDASYVARYCSGDMGRDELRRLGLPWSPELARRTLRAVGGSLLAAEQALTHGLACHLAGGTHHAHRAEASGFCIFNDLALIALSLLAEGRVGRVLIFDCDVHQGDGTARILETVPDAITVSLHCEKNFPVRKARSDWDIPLGSGMGDAEYLQVVEQTLSYLLPLYQPDLVVYDAGVDVHREDSLGLLNLSDEGIRARDSLVLDHCLLRDIPVVGVIGGGYGKDPAEVARRHASLHFSAAAAWQRHGLGGHRAF